MARIAGAINSTIISPSISPTLPKSRLCQKRRKLMTPVAIKIINTLWDEIDLVTERLKGIKNLIAAVRDEEEKYSEYVSPSYQASREVGEILDDALGYIESALLELDAIPQDLEDVTQSWTSKALREASINAKALCGYLDTAIMRQDQGTSMYKENALERAGKILADISASLGKQPRIIPEPAIIHEENNHEPA